MQRETSRQWKELDESAKSKYTKLAAADKVRYQKEMDAYKGGGKAKADPDDDDDDDDDDGLAGDDDSDDE